MGWQSIDYVAGKIPAKKHWALSALSENDMLFVKEFGWGHEVDLFPSEMVPDENSHIVGIVLSGICEVYDYDTIETSDPIYCHRPIRLLESGDVFNDFEFVDRKVLGKNLEHDARKGEKWGVLSGISSMIAIVPDPELVESEEQPKKIKKIHILTSQYDNNSRFENTIQGFIRDNNKSAKSEIAYFRVQLDDVKSEFLLDMLKSAWKRVLTYREGPNSYNISKRVKFINQCNRIITITDNERRSGDKFAPYGSKLQNITILPIFIEAIFDAIDRINRHEPLFVWAPDKYYGADFSNAPTKCLVSKRIRTGDKEFYFPIDLANHIICSFAKQHSNTELDILNGFSQKSLRAPRKNSNNEYHGKDENGLEYKGSNKHFWKVTAEKIIKAWELNNTEFSYKLSVELLSNENLQRLLFVKFVRKPSSESTK